MQSDEQNLFKNGISNQKLLESISNLANEEFDNYDIIYSSQINKIQKIYSHKKNSVCCLKTYNCNFNFIAFHEIYINQLIKNYLKIRRNSILNFFDFYILEKKSENIQEKFKLENNNEIKGNELSNKYYMSKEVSLIFEYTPFGNMIDFLTKNENYFQSIKNVKHFLLDVITALIELHKIGIVHNDIKLDNILTFKINKKIVAKICDFNNSFYIHDIKSNFLNENHYYKFGFFEKPGFKSDFFELGIVLFQILFFENPLIYLKKFNINKEQKMRKISHNIIESSTKNLLKIEYNKYNRSINDISDFEETKLCYYLDLNKNKKFRNFGHSKLKDFILKLLQTNSFKRPDDQNILKQSFFKTKNSKLSSQKNFCKISILKNLRTNKIVKRLTVF